MVSRSTGNVVILALFLALLVPAVQAETVVVNSDDWMDVYSGMEYAFLNNWNAQFLTGKRGAVLLPLIIPKSEKVIVIESQRVPFTINLAGNLKAGAYQAEPIYTSGGRATNIELAKRLGTTHFIVIDPAYGYNAIAVAPYAQATNAYVLFADAKNADQVLAFLNGRTVDALLLYGQLDEGLVEKLGAFSPEVINKGNRYKDNREILGKHLAVANVPQLIVTDGSMIEEELMGAGKSSETTLLIGKSAIPDDVLNLVKNSHFQSIVLLGNHLTPQAKRIKDETGIPVFVKFGRGIGTGTQSEPVKALDMFPLPIINIELAFRKAQYNTVTKNVEITYDNKGIRAFAKTAAGILAAGTRIAAVGDAEAQRIESNQTASYQYSLDLTEQIANKQELVLDLLTLYGESADTFDNAITLTAPLQVVTLQDRCELNARSVQYNAKTQRFMVKIENDGPVDCFATVELRDVIVNDVPVNVATPESVTIAEGETETVEIKQRMTDVDIADNPAVSLRVRYGERQEFLLSLLEARLPLGMYAGTLFTPTNILLGVIALLLIIIIVMWLMQRRRPKKK